MIVLPVRGKAAMEKKKSVSGMNLISRLNGSSVLRGPGERVHTTHSGCVCVVFEQNLGT